MSIEELLRKADALLSEEMKTELRRQGHYNTGALDQSIEGSIHNDHLEGTANYYAAILDAGYGRERASMRQFPFLVQFFESKGHNEEDAKRYAAMTIKKWMKEGVPTANSSSYSETGRRTQFIAIVKKAINGKVNTVMNDGLDKIINEKFHETKSEKI